MNSQNLFSRKNQKIKLPAEILPSMQSANLCPLNPDIPCFANSVDPDQLASEEANWSGSALFAIKYANL